MNKENPVFFITHWSIRGSKHMFETDRDIWKIIDKLEDMWDYVLVEDNKHNIIYKTRGLDAFLES